MRWYMLALAACLAAPSVAQDAPFAVRPGMFDFSRRNDLGLGPAPGAQTFTIFRAGSKTDHYVNGVVLMPFKRRLYAQWQSSAQDEDAPDTHVVYAISSDGEHWSTPKALTLAAGNMTTSGGWWSDGTLLVAYINVWNADIRTGGHTEYMTSRDGRRWSERHPVMGSDGRPVQGIIEQDPHALPDGRIITAFHLQPGLIATPFYSDDPKGLSGWTAGRMVHLSHKGGQSRELEPSWYRRADGCVVMVFRDQASSFRVLAAQSCDRGVSWTTPVVTSMPDSRAKQSAGNLPEGTAFLVNAPSGNAERSPLVLSMSRDGRTFDHAFALRTGPLLPLSYEGRYKRPGFHYPKSVVWNGALWVSYASGKESADVTRIPLRSGSSFLRL